jgi:hypothetical protein
MRANVLLFLGGQFFIALRRWEFRLIEKNGRGAWIRTTGLLVPNQMPALVEIYGFVLILSVWC